MPSAKYVLGDVRECLAATPDHSIDLVLSSPPFLGLRTYLPEGHPDKGKEVGAETTPAAFISTLLGIAQDIRRVLTPGGSMVIELGDSYAGGGAGGGDNQEGSQGKLTNKKKLAAAKANGVAVPKKSGPGWPMDKSLCGIPTLFTWSLAYGRNLLAPDHVVDPWIVRNLVAWCRPNPMVGQLFDKFRPGSSYITVATLSGQRWYDADAVRVVDPDTGKDGPMLDWHVVPGRPYKGAHGAVWPLDLLPPFIKAMCPPDGTVLDIFGGSGTTLEAAVGLGRNAIGFDIDQRNVALAEDRVGPMFFEAMTIDDYRKANDAGVD